MEHEVPICGWLDWLNPGIMTALFDYACIMHAQCSMLNPGCSLVQMRGTAG